MIKRSVMMTWLAVMICAAAQGGYAMDLTSTAFQPGGVIPSKYTCDGRDISPPLTWGHAPANTRGFALVCDDPDAPMGTWVHWVYFDIPPQMTSLPEHVAATENPPSGGRQGINDFRKHGYGGPCPPGGEHRYFFKLYALDAQLNLPAATTKAQLLKAMDGHVLSQAQLMGKYKRK